MVVITIIGILLAMAIPTFLGATRRAQDTRTKSNVATALKAAKAMGADGDYDDVNAAALQLEEGALGFVDATIASPDPSVVSATVPDVDALTVVIAGQSDS